MKLLREPVRPKSSVLRSVGEKQVSDLWKDYLWESYED